MNKISIIIPVYNEISTLDKILEKVEQASFCALEKEIILVDDMSTDGTREHLKELEDRYKVFYHNYNQGKGAAIRTGMAHISGDIMVIQDADLEYDPADYEPLIKLIVDDKAKYAAWSARDDIKAEFKVNIILKLADYHYPPVTVDEVYKETEY